MGFRSVGNYNATLSSDSLENRYRQFEFSSLRQRLSLVEVLAAKLGGNSLRFSRVIYPVSTNEEVGFCWIRIQDNPLARYARNIYGKVLNGQGGGG